MNSVLITGGTGYFGRGMIRHLLSNKLSERICVFSRDEYKQALLRKSFEDDQRLRFFVGDVRDPQRLKRALMGVDLVIHAAALKRIETGHYNPDEMLKTNVIGALNVADMAAEAGVKKVILLSTDKAFAPVSPYGFSKALAESIFLSSNHTHRSTEYAVTRYGNVAGSTGSVIPAWRSLKDSGSQSVPVTDPECTRYWMTLQQAVDLVLHTVEVMPIAPVIPTLPAFRLADLAAAMEMKMNIKGLPSHEKLHESMSFSDCSATARRMSVEEIREALNYVD